MSNRHLELNMFKTEHSFHSLLKKTTKKPGLVVHAVIIALGRLKQEDGELEASLSQNKTKRKKKSHLFFPVIPISINVTLSTKLFKPKT
jgi:hypothetical protein